MINPHRIPWSALLLLSMVRPTRTTTAGAPPRTHFPPTLSAQNHLVVVPSAPVLR